MRISNTPLLYQSKQLKEQTPEILYWQKQLELLCQDKSKKKKSKKVQYSILITKQGIACKNDLDALDKGSL